MKGQVSFEYIMLIGIVLFVSIPLFYYGISRTREDLRLQQASDAVNSIINTADSVYSLGLGSRDFIWVNTPTGITNASIDDKTLTITISIYGASSDISFISKANFYTLTKLTNI